MSFNKEKLLERRAKIEQQYAQHQAQFNVLIGHLAEIDDLIKSLSEEVVEPVKTVKTKSTAKKRK